MNNSAGFDFILQKHKFRIDSNEDILYGMLMDNNCGIFWDAEGNSRFTTDKTSLEVVGKKIKIGPNERIPAKWINAKNGDIVLDAENGNIVLRAANIQIVSNDPLGGAVTISSTKNVRIDSPITNVQGENFCVAAVMEASVTGGSLSNHGEYNNESTTGTDIIKASWYGKVLTAIKKFQKFFDSICGDKK